MERKLAFITRTPHRRLNTASLIFFRVAEAWRKPAGGGVRVRVAEALEQTKSAGVAAIYFSKIPRARVAETLEHCFWRCPCWQDIGLPARHVTDLWPCGCFLVNEGVIQANMPLEEEEEEARAGTWIEEWSAEAQGETATPNEHISNERVVIWTDGASRNNADARLCRAGC